MENVIENFLELKSKILETIVFKGTEGISESLIFRNLHNEAKHSKVFDYQEGLTADKLVDSLINEGEIRKVCYKEFTECRFIASERYFW